MEMNGKLMETMEMNRKPKKTNASNGDEWKT